MHSDGAVQRHGIKSAPIGESVSVDKRPSDGEKNEPDRGCL